jgi:hypothetical protein
MTLLPQGELEHRTAKARYKRTSKKDFVRQMAQIERRQARIRLIRQRVAKISVTENECLPNTLEAHHHIGVSEACTLRFGPFLQSHHGDPAVAVGFSQSKALIDC